MTGTVMDNRVRRLTAILVVGPVLLVGCASAIRTDPVSLANATLGPMTIAVAPALNLSGSADFDRNRFADLMASELSYADGVSVIPVSRVLGVLATQGHSGVQSPTHALELAGLLGADAILVFAVTEYDANDPPSIGISGELYGARPWLRRGAINPTTFSRRAKLAGSPRKSSGNRVLAQIQQVYDASHASVVADIKRFAELRGGDESPYGWRKYVVSQQHFIRYCCHAAIRELLGTRNDDDDDETSADEVERQ